MENLASLSKLDQEAYLAQQSPEELFKLFEASDKSNPLSDIILSVFFSKTDETDPIYVSGLIAAAKALAAAHPLQSLSKLLVVTQISEGHTENVFDIAKGLVSANRGPEFLALVEKFIELTTGLNQIRYLKLMADVQPSSIEIFNNIWDIVYELNPPLGQVLEILQLDNDLLPAPIESSDFVATQKPKLVYKGKFLETWWVCDTSESKAYVYLGLLINDLRSTLQKSVTADLIAIILTLGLNNELGAKLAQAGFQVSIEPLDNCLEIKISGHASKILDASEKIMEFIYNSCPTSETYESALVMLRQQYESMTSDPSNQSRQLRLAFLQHQQYLYPEKLKYLSSSCYTDLNFANVKILLFACGHLFESQTTDLAEFIDGLLFAAEGKKLKYLTPRTVTLLPDQIIELVQQVLVEANSESVIEVYFQFGQASIEERVLTALLEMIVADSISEELIKKNCKSVNVSSRMTRGVSGLLIKAVTVDKHPDQVQAEVFDFVSRLQSVVVSSFEDKKSKLVEAKSQGFRSLYDKSTFLWDEILQGNLEFERELKELDYAKALEVSTILDWISRNKVNSKALVVKVMSQKWGEVSHRFTEEFTLDTENVRNRIPCYSWLRIMH